ncbi:MAG: hypothetical protein LKI32_07250 [Lachnospiraceae bacterium]|jgi:Cdc6-like AAA superfamily ATPase|nr:hypothetical protein [Lachnospiraceae bacterium]MCI1657337.1 hypothetical protein [Lachnospiraceae bacterium]MCI2195815.1 hypothetical protein [Lachnospiraceae bacterium]
MMLDEKIKEYDERFDGFPTIAFSSYTDSEVIKIIDDCLKRGKDVYDAGYLDINAVY